MSCCFGINMCESVRVFKQLRHRLNTFTFHRVLCFVLLRYFPTQAVNNTLIYSWEPQLKVSTPYALLRSSCFSHQYFNSKPQKIKIDNLLYPEAMGASSHL